MRSHGKSPQRKKQFEKPHQKIIQIIMKTSIDTIAAFTAASIWADGVYDEAEKIAVEEVAESLELAPIIKQLGEIQCKQPNTVTVPYQPFVTVPNCVAYKGLYGFGGNGSIWS